MAKRIQMTRQAPWRASNPDAVIVARGLGRKWGNPCKVSDREYASASYAAWLNGCNLKRDLYGLPPTVAEIRAELAGKDLACWCDHNGHCHADALLHIANAPTIESAEDLLSRMFVFGPYPSPSQETSHDK